MASAPARWDLEVDVVAIGSGLGGTCAVIAAHDLGASCALLEKAPRLGGLSGYGGGEVFVPNNHKMRALGIEDSDEAGRRYLEFVAAGFQSPAHLDRLLAAHKQAVEYFEQKAGSGDSPTATDTVKVHYVGTLVDGTEFDSSRSRGEPAEFPLGGVIKCWTEGLQRMKPGGVSKLVCPSDIAYGDRGRPKIPGGAALIFEVELLEVKPKAAPAPAPTPAPTQGEKNE